MPVERGRNAVGRPEMVNGLCFPSLVSIYAAEGPVKLVDYGFLAFLIVEISEPVVIKEE